MPSTLGTIYFEKEEAYLLVRGLRLLVSWYKANSRRLDRVLYRTSKALWFLTGGVPREVTVLGMVREIEALTQKVISLEVRPSAGELITLSDAIDALLVRHREALRPLHTSGKKGKGILTKMEMGYLHTMHTFIAKEAP